MEALKVWSSRPLRHLFHLSPLTYKTHLPVTFTRCCSYSRAATVPPKQGGGRGRRSPKDENNATSSTSDRDAILVGYDAAWSKRESLTLAARFVCTWLRLASFMHFVDACFLDACVANVSSANVCLGSAKILLNVFINSGHKCINCDCVLLGYDDSSTMLCCCGKWKDGKVRESLASATSTSPATTSINLSQFYHVFVEQGTPNFMGLGEHKRGKELLMQFAKVNEFAKGLHWSTRTWETDQCHHDSFLPLTLEQKTGLQQSTAVEGRGRSWLIVGVVLYYLCAGGALV
ncbi:hypothetical protein Tco_0826644 [Tanacetum coccineum]